MAAGRAGLWLQVKRSQGPPRSELGNDVIMWAWWCCGLRSRAAETIAEVNADGAIAEYAAWRCFLALDSWHHIAEGLLLHGAWSAGSLGGGALDRWAEERWDRGVTEERRKQILVRRRSEAGCGFQTEFPVSWTGRSQRPGAFWVFTRHPGASTDGSGGVVNERSVLTLVWLKLRWLDGSVGIQLQIERRKQWKS